MKTTRKEILSVITIATAALVFTLTILISAHAAAVDGDRLLLVLALCGYSMYRVWRSERTY